nr:uncharacterized protein LOC109156431 isoform X2 [Ipomoea batatas]GMD72508.1 uncharacterized protein LOC109156431 isoform X2 [Ipomoea batatas]
MSSCFSWHILMRMRAPTEGSCDCIASRLKVESREEMRERDEARNRIQKVLTSFSQVVQTDQSPLVKLARANSWLTESNNLSDTQNHYGSSPLSNLSCLI